MAMVEDNRTSKTSFDCFKLYGSWVGLPAVLFVSLWVLSSSLYCGYWPGLFHLLVFLLCYGRLYKVRRSISILAGAGAWLLLAISRVEISNGVWLIVLRSIYAVVVMSNVWAGCGWLWRLPLARGRKVMVLGSLLAGVVLLLRPYLVASYWGRGADLRGARLILADLQGADLRRADLRGADLRGACLSGANVEGADVRGANLEGAVMEKADLFGMLYGGSTRRGGWDLDSQGAKRVD
jgi:hypothetical protein